MEIFERFAALVILAIAAKTASATIGEYLPRPSIIIGLGLVASLRPNGFEFALVPDPSYVAYGTGAAVIGVGFALGVALLGPWLRGNVDIDRFRFGSAVALGVLPLSILQVGPITGEEPLALIVLAITALLAFDPDGAVDAAFGRREPDSTPAATDGGDASVDYDGAADGADASDDGPADDDASPRVSDGERAPWL